MKFKIGQTVKLINNDGIEADIGATAVIYKITDAYVSVHWLTNYHRQMDGGYWPHQFEPCAEVGQQLEFDFMSE